MKSSKYLFRTACITIVLLMFSPLALAEGVSITTFAGGANASYKDGNSAEACFNQPYGLAMDKDGGLLVVDTNNNRIRRIKDGSVTTIAGFCDRKDTFGQPLGGFADGDALKARFNKPRGIAIDTKGNIFISDTGNNVIRKIANGKVYTFAGTGTAGYTNGNASVVRFNAPAGLAIDSNDNIYVADSLNNVIRKITPKGEVSTFAGKYAADGGYADGPWYEAMFVEPADVEMDLNGVLYTLDTGNQLVRKVENGQVSTFAGTRGELIPDTGYTQGGFLNGKSDKAKFNFPKGMEVTREGIIFISDTWNHRIRAIKPDGSVVTISGTGIPGKMDGSATGAQFNGPVDVLYSTDCIYISDMWNNCIRKIPVDIKSITEIVDRSELIKGITFGAETGETQIWFNKSNVNLPDVKPYILNKKVYVPLRFVSEAWGAKVGWQGETARVTVAKGDFYKEFTVTSDPIVFKDERTMIDIESLEQILGLRIEWFPEYNAVVISA